MKRMLLNFCIWSGEEILELRLFLCGFASGLLFSFFLSLPSCFMKNNVIGGMGLFSSRTKDAYA